MDEMNERFIVQETKSDVQRDDVDNHTNNSGVYKFERLLISSPLVFAFLPCLVKNLFDFLIFLPYRV